MFALKIITQFSPQDDIAISSSDATITYVSWFHDYFAWQHIAPVGKTARHLSSPEASPASQASHTFGSSKTIILMISYRLHFWLKIMVHIFGRCDKFWIKMDQMSIFLSQLLTNSCQPFGASSLLRSVSITKSSGMRSLSCLLPRFLWQ